jgi:hypothetical protein
MSDEAKEKLADVPNLIQLAKIAEDKPWKLLPLGVRRTPRVAIRIQLNRILRLVSQMNNCQLCQFANSWEVINN